MTDPNNKIPSRTFKFLEQLGMSRADILAENAEPVLAAKMTVAGFIDQATHFLGALKAGIMSSPNGIEIETARIFLQSSKQAVEYAMNALDKYEKIRETSRALTKLKLSKAANDNDVPDEVTEFVYHHPTVPQDDPTELDSPKEEEEPEGIATSHPPNPTNKKLN